jgi:serine/threonine protein phosphatase PrpC
MTPEVKPPLSEGVLTSAFDGTEFLRIDNEKVPQMQQIYTGSTGIICVITNKHIIVANIADSPAILFTKEGIKLEQTDIHNCDNPWEKARIDQDNTLPLCLPVSPMISHQRLKDKYTNNGLDMTRAFGDQGFKPKANAIPQLYIWDRVEDQILCVCSDSFFEDKLDKSKSDQDEQDIINEIIPVLKQTKFNPQSSAEYIVKRRTIIIKGDNTSMILVIL